MVAALPAGEDGRAGRGAAAAAGGAAAAAPAAAAGSAAGAPSSSLSGVGDILAAVAPALTAAPAGPPARAMETREARRERLATERAASHAAAVATAAVAWDPRADPAATEDPFRTLFVARLARATTEDTLTRVFSGYGAVRRAVIVRDGAGVSRGYAFVEFAEEADVRAAFRRADGSEIDGRKILCDVERGRTVRGWRPRRLGGGLGRTREAAPKKTRDRKATLVYPAAGAGPVRIGVDGCRWDAGALGRRPRP